MFVAPLALVAAIEIDYLAVADFAIVVARLAVVAANDSVFLAVSSAASFLQSRLSVAVFSSLQP